MAKIKLTEAMLHMRRYFSPLCVSMKLVSPTSMDLTLLDPASNEMVILAAIPCRSSITPTELYQLINLIETQAKARQPSLFTTHFVNTLSQS